MRVSLIGTYRVGNRLSGNALLLLGVILMVGCSSFNDDDTIQTAFVSEEDFSIDTMQFGTPGTVRNLPFSIFSMNSLNPDEFYFGYDRQTHRILRFSFIQKQYVRTIKLSNAGPNGISTLISLFYLSPDSLFLLELNPNRLWLMDEDENLDLIVDIGKQSEVDQCMKELFAVNYNNASPIYYRKGRIYFTTRPYGSKSDFKHPAIGYYDMTTHRLDTLPIHYPQVFNEEFYGFFNFANVLFDEDRIIVNFPISTTIYIYDYSGDLIFQTGSLPGIKDTPPLRRINDQSVWMDHVNGSPYLYPIQILRQGEFFVQFGRDAVPPEDSDVIAGYNLIYSKDFRRVWIYKVNKIFHSNGGSFLFHQLPIESSDWQKIELYEFDW